MPDTLATFPYVVVRIGCRHCRRSGAYRLARLADKYGAGCDMERLLEFIAGDCRYWRPRHPYQLGCGAFFPDLEPPQGPADVPTEMRKLRIVRT